MPAFDALATCKPEEQLPVRRKRFIWLLAAVLLVVAVAVICLAATAAVYIVENHDRIEKLEERAKKLDRKISLETYSFEKVEGYANDSNNAIEALKQETALNRKAIYELSGLLPEMTWTSLSLYHNILRQQKLLTKLAKL